MPASKGFHLQIKKWRESQKKPSIPQEVAHNWAEPRKVPMAFGYARISTEQQGDDTTALQEGRIVQHYESRLKPEGIDWGGCEHDDGVSAFKLPFRNRPGGQKLLAKMKSGDHIVFDKIDRVWRSIQDFVDLQRLFRERGIKYHFVHMMGVSLESDTPMGEFVMGLMVLIAQLESRTISDRTKRGLAARKAEGLMSGPCGSWMTPDRYGKLHPNYDEIRWINMLFRLDTLHPEWSRRELSDALERAICEAEGKEYHEYSEFRPRKFSPHKCRLVIHKYKNVFVSSLSEEEREEWEDYIENGGTPPK